MARSLRRLRKFLVRILEPQRHEERRAAEPQPTTSALKPGLGTFLRSIHKAEDAEVRAEARRGGKAAAGSINPRGLRAD